MKNGFLSFALIRLIETVAVPDRLGIPGEEQNRHFVIIVMFGVVFACNSRRRKKILRKILTHIRCHNLDAIILSFIIVQFSCNRYRPSLIINHEIIKTALLYAIPKLIQWKSAENARCEIKLYYTLFLYRCEVVEKWISHYSRQTHHSLESIKMCHFDKSR